MMNSFGSILHNKNNPTPLIRGVNAALTIEAANGVLLELFGESIQEYATAAYIKDEVLCIACLSMAAAQEIKMREQEVLEKIKAKMPAASITKVRYLS